MAGKTAKWRGKKKAKRIMGPENGKQTEADVKTKEERKRKKKEKRKRTMRKTGKNVGGRGVIMGKITR